MSKNILSLKLCTWCCINWIFYCDDYYFFVEMLLSLNLTLLSWQMKGWQSCWLHVNAYTLSLCLHWSTADSNVSVRSWLGRERFDSCRQLRLSKPLRGLRSSLRVCHPTAAVANSIVLYGATAACWSCRPKSVSEGLGCGLGCTRALFVDTYRVPTYMTHRARVQPRPQSKPLLTEFGLLPYNHT